MQTSSGIDALLSGETALRRGKVDSEDRSLSRLMELYRTAIGNGGVLLWLSLRTAAQTSGSVGPQLLAEAGLDQAEAEEVFAKLAAYRLIEIDGPTGQRVPRLCIVVNDPLGDAEFEAAFAGEEPAQAPAAQAAAAEPPSKGSLIKGLELERVFAKFHERIGLLGPQQFEALREWVEDRGMAVEVVENAIERVADSGKRTFSYLEGVLRNMYNSGLRTLADLERSEQGRAGRTAASQGASSSGAPGQPEGVPNAAAYVKVDKDLIRRWKESHPDEYPS